MTVPTNPCRCGHAGDGPHPCHAKGYRCGAPATQWFYNAQRVALAGMQPKLQVTETWACDACWGSFKAMLKDAE
jgi:hypothetical protein